MNIVNGILFLGIIVFLAYMFFICLMKMFYDERFYPGREVYIYIESINDIEKDVVIKHEDGIVYTKMHGCFTFKDYLKDNINEC